MMACGDCRGVLTGGYSPIVVPRIDEEGFPQLDGNGKLRYITIRLPDHLCQLVADHPNPFDPTGLSPADCAHGIPEHPAGLLLRYGGQSWIRSKYLDVQKGGIKCPACQGQPAPEDLSTPRAA
jgi:hypothetical protein